MKGHIRRRGKSSWAVVIFLGRDPSGKQHRKWHAVRGNRKDAQRELARLLNEISTGAYVEPARMTVSEFLDRWLADYAKPKVSPKTYERYQEMIDGHIRPALGSHLLPKLAPLHVQTFYGCALAKGRKDGKGGLSRQSVVHFHRLLHKAFAQAVKWQLRARNPIEAVEPPRAQRQEMRALDEDETANLLRLLGESRLYIPVMLAVTTGLRRGEILGLRWSNVNLATGTITVVQSLEQTREGLRFKSPKTHRSRRSIALPAMTVEVLRSHRVKQAEGSGVGCSCRHRGETAGEVQGASYLSGRESCRVRCRTQENASRMEWFAIGLQFESGGSFSTGVRLRPVQQPIKTP